jgi:hypothetical protein
MGVNARRNTHCHRCGVGLRNYDAIHHALTCGGPIPKRTVVEDGDADRFLSSSGRMVKLLRRRGSDGKLARYWIVRVNGRRVNLGTEDRQEAIKRARRIFDK